MAKSKDHVHTYKRYKKRSGKLARDWVFFCAAPDCRHISDYERTIGKKTLCNDCGGEFILDTQSIKRIEPKCLNCSNSKRAQVFQRAAALLTTILPDQEQYAIEDERKRRGEDDDWRL